MELAQEIPYEQLNTLIVRIDRLRHALISYLTRQSTE